MLLDCCLIADLIFLVLQFDSSKLEYIKMLNFRITHNLAIPDAHLITVLA